MLADRAAPEPYRGGATARQLAAAAIFALAGGALTAFLPSFAFQLSALLALAALVGAALWTGSGRVLNPAWVVVTWLYLIGPIGTILIDRGIGLQMTAIAALAPLTFVGAVLLTRSDVRARLVLLAPMAGLLLFAALSLAWSEDPSYGVTKLTLSLWNGFLPAACIMVLAAASPRVTWQWVVALALLSAVALMAYATPSPDYPGRPTLFDANPIWAARALFVGAIVAMFGPFPRVVRLVTAPVMIVAGLMTVSLGPALGLAVGTWAGVGAYLRSGNRLERRLFATWAVLGLAIGLGILAALAGGADADSSLVSSLAKQQDLTSRQAYLDASLPLFAGSPLIGIGIGGFAATHLDTYPHNLFVEIAVELGVAGLIAFGAWLWLAIRGAAHSPMLVALLAASTVFTLFSGSLASNTELWMFSGLAVASYPLKRLGERPGGDAAVVRPPRI